MAPSRKLALLLTTIIITALGNYRNQIQAIDRQSCPRDCPKVGMNSEYSQEMFFTPFLSKATLYIRMRSPIGQRLSDEKFDVKKGETMHVTRTTIRKDTKDTTGVTKNMKISLDQFYVGGIILYCSGTETDVDPKCLTLTTTTSTTTTTTTTTTTPTTTTTTTTTTATTTIPPLQQTNTTTTTTATTITKLTTAATPQNTTETGTERDFRPSWVETFIFVLSLLSITLRLGFVIKAVVVYCKTVCGVDRDIAHSRLITRGDMTYKTLLIVLKNAVVLDFWLRVCLFALLLALCSCGYTLYQIVTPIKTRSAREDIYLTSYTLGGLCFLLHSFYCVRRTNWVITGRENRTVAPPVPMRPYKFQGQKAETEEEEEVERIVESLGGSAGCYQFVGPVLKGCLLVLLLGLCVLSYCLYIVVVGLEEEE